MLSVCRYYIKDIHYAEDMMVKGFLKVFLKLGTFRQEGSFESWVRKIMVRECISYLRTNKLEIASDVPVTSQTRYDNTSHGTLDADYLQLLIDGLPNGYRMVFILHAIEGYKHMEIAKILDISESTSRSQLSKARKLLQQKVKIITNRRYGAI